MATAIRGYKNQKKIMKKEYIKPEMVVEEIVLETMLLADSIIPGEDGEVGEGDILSNDRRGSWGNLWTSED